MLASAATVALACGSHTLPVAVYGAPDAADIDEAIVPFYGGMDVSQPDASSDVATDASDESQDGADSSGG